MSQGESHPIRNGVAATVIGGLILAALSFVWSPAKAALIWMWGTLTGIWHVLITSYKVPGWILFLLVMIVATALVRTCLRFVRGASVVPFYLAYISDVIHGANWHWSWHQGRISKLWAACPACQGELVYLNDRDNYLLAVPRAKFFCEHCQKVVVDIQGGDRDYALSAVEREIHRRLRVSESQRGSNKSG